MFTAVGGGGGEGGGGADGTKFFHSFPHDAVFFDISPLDQEKKMTTPWSW